MSAAPGWPSQARTDELGARLEAAVGMPVVDPCQAAARTAARFVQRVQ